MFVIDKDGIACANPQINDPEEMRSWAMKIWGISKEEFELEYKVSIDGSTSTDTVSFTQTGYQVFNEQVDPK